MSNDNFTTHVLEPLISNNNSNFINYSINSSANQSDLITKINTAKEIEKLALACLLGIVIVIVIFGNTLVIVAIVTTKRLRTITNCFVMSLAIADWLVGTFVMPPAVADSLMGAWELGWILCDIWVSLDILSCTASILSLCAISVDRYLAVTQPLSYSRKRRSKRLAFTMILIVWISSFLITCPPMLGWYEPGRHDQKTCRYNKNTGYVIFSAMGSFFIPLIVMLYVYVRISCIVAQRHDHLAHIDNNSRKSQKQLVLNVKEESELERASSECDENNIRCTRYFRPLSACNQEDDLKNHQSSDQRKSLPNHTKSLKTHLNYSFNQDPLTPKRSTSFYRTPLSSQRSRPESLNLDAAILNFEPATRVSSFRRETKTARTLSIVMGGFIVCWLPFFVFYLLTPFLPSNRALKITMQYLTWLGWMNSAINPFIYAFYSPDFRIAFWRLTLKHFSKTRRPDFAFQHK